ncbi:MAG: RecX family transcriptional regulator [Saprospiraceae bacterium]|nr:RecX family transcriptional regulator [Saprospiraceae bacterium]
MKQPTKNLTSEEIVQKLQRFCAYQERCVFDIKTKLFDLKVPKYKHDEIIDKLIDDDFLNEERFTEIFIRGKLNQKKWGRVKIIFALKQKHIPDSLIKLKIAEIDKNQYSKILKDVILKKKSLLEKKETENLKTKLAAYASSKGFESDLIWEVINELDFKL